VAQRDRGHGPLGRSTRGFPVRSIARFGERWSCDADEPRFGPDIRDATAAHACRRPSDRLLSGRWCPRNQLMSARLRAGGCGSAHISGCAGFPTRVRRHAITVPTVSDTAQLV